MSSRDEILNFLQQNLKSKRVKHSLGVEQTSRDLALRYGVDPEKAALAGLLHDCAKGMNKAQLCAYTARSPFPMTEDTLEEVLHSPAGMVLAKERFQVDDEEILSAICWHTVPKLNMSKLDMIVSLADMIEPTRDFEGVEELRKLARKDLEAAFCAALAHTMIYVLQKGNPVEPGTMSEYNRLILKNKQK